MPFQDNSKLFNLMSSSFDFRNWRHKEKQQNKNFVYGCSKKESTECVFYIACGFLKRSKKRCNCPRAIND